METKQLALTAAKGRQLALTCVYEAASGHPGGSMSAMDLMTVLYFDVMNIDPKNPQAPGRDRFVLSKGHCTPALYSILALRGYFPLEDLHKFRRIDAHYSGHPDMVHVKGVDMSTGSLGQGISAAVGMALAGKLDRKDYRVYTVMGDGELAEGSVWEAAMSASQYGLDNLCAVVDRNRLQISGSTEDVMHQDSQEQRWAAFGWNVITVSGHDYDALAGAFSAARGCKGKPTVLIAETVKGFGSAVMENKAGWHHHVPTQEEYHQIMADFAAGQEAALHE